MNKEQKLYELRKEEERLLRQEESLLKEKRMLENQIEDLKGTVQMHKPRSGILSRLILILESFLSSCSQRHPMSHE